MDSDPDLTSLVERRIAFHRRASETIGLSDSGPESAGAAEDWSPVDRSPEGALRLAALMGSADGGRFMGCSAEDRAFRAARAELLGAVVNGRPDQAEVVVPQLLELAQGEGRPVVLVALAYALGRAGDERARPFLLTLADHPDDRVRFAAVQALPSVTVATDDARDRQAHPDVVAALVAATRDEQAPIRDWATFGLGQLEAQGDAVDDALLDRTSDPHVDTRAEALMALAQRRDERVIRHLQRELAGDQAGTLVLRAAGWLADPRLHDALVTVAAASDDDLDDPNSFGSVARRAALRCDPQARAEAEQVEVGLLASLDAVALDTPADGSTQGPADQADTERVAVGLIGSYPATEMVFSLGDREIRSPIWNFDEQDPASPSTIDHAFTLFRLRNVGNRL